MPHPADLAVGALQEDHGAVLHLVDLAVGALQEDHGAVLHLVDLGVGTIQDDHGAVLHPADLGVGTIQDALGLIQRAPGEAFQAEIGAMLLEGHEFLTTVWRTGKRVKTRLINSFFI